MSYPAESTPTSADVGSIPQPGEHVAGAYVIRRQIGQGGMGAVFEALSLATQQLVAVKWVLPSASDGRPRERLLREAQLAGRIEHPNVVSVLEVGEDRGSIFLVMELLVGEPLEAWVERGPHDPLTVVRLMMPVLRGVEAAHRAGVVHRDLKPHNIVLCRDPASGGLRPTVIDFGISRAARSDVPGDLTLTQTGIMIGTPLYMAPEQLAAVVEPDPRCDVYALGLILYELLSAGVPFEAETAGLLVAEKLSRPAMPLRRYVPGVEGRLERVVMKALERDPRRRWASAAALGRALEAVADARFEDPSPLYLGPGLDAGGTTVRARRVVKREPARRWPWIVAAGAGLGLLLCAAAFTAVALVPRPPPMTVLEVSPVRSPDLASEDARPEPQADPGAPQAGPGAAQAGPGAAQADPVAAEADPAEVEPGSAEGEPPGAAEPSRARPRRPGRTGRLRVDDF